MQTVYPINKGVNAPLEFRGLRAQYIWHLGAGLAILLLLFVSLYTLGAGAYLSLGIILVLGGGLFRGVYYLNDRYGPHGFMRLAASRKMPSAMIMTTRKSFIKKHP